MTLDLIGLRKAAEEHVRAGAFSNRLAWRDDVTPKEALALLDLVKELREALDGVRPAVRAPGCWCPQSRGSVDHSMLCLRAQAAIEKARGT